MIILGWWAQQAGAIRIMEKYRRIRSFLVSCARIDLLGRTNRPVQSAASKTVCFVQEVGSQIRAATASHAAISLCP